MVLFSGDIQEHVWKYPHNKIMVLLSGNLSENKTMVLFQGGLIYGKSGCIGSFYFSLVSSLALSRSFIIRQWAVKQTSFNLGVEHANIDVTLLMVTFVVLFFDHVMNKVTYVL
jgi:hypothetical protein